MERYVWTRLSISSGSIYEVINLHNVSGFTSALFNVLSGNQSGASGSSDADIGSVFNPDPDVVFSDPSPTPLRFEVECLSTNKSNNGKPDVSPCHLVYPSSSKYKYESDKDIFAVCSTSISSPIAVAFTNVCCVIPGAPKRLFKVLFGLASVSGDGKCAEGLVSVIELREGWGAAGGKAWESETTENPGAVGEDGIGVSGTFCGCWSCIPEPDGAGSERPAKTAGGIAAMSVSRWCILSSSVVVRLDLCVCVLFPGSSNVHAELAAIHA